MTSARDRRASPVYRFQEDAAIKVAAKTKYTDVLAKETHAEVLQTL